MKKIVKTRSELASAVAIEAVAVIDSCIKSSGSCRIVLTGGGLGMEVLKALSKADVDWSKITVIFSDERFVDPTDSDRNEFQALGQLPQLIGSTWLRYPERTSDLESSAELFSNQLEHVLGKVELTDAAFDLVLLGMGPDGHVASLFPGRLHSRQWIVSEDSSPKPPSSRLSLSYEALCRGERVWFIASGKEKAGAAKSAMNSSDLPAGRVKGQKETVWWIDQELSDEL